MFFCLTWYNEENKEKERSYPMKTSKDIIATVETDYGKISISDAVVKSFVQNLIQEIPGIHEIELKNLIFKSTQSGEVAVTTGDEMDSIDLTVSVCVLGTVKVVEVAEQLQQRLMLDIPQFLGVKINTVVVQIKQIVFHDEK